MAGEIDLDLVRTFLTAYRTRSLSRAARELGRAQSTVTAQIAALESELGHELFQRRPTGVVPTTRADALAARVARPLDELEEVLWAGRPGTDDHPIHLGGPAEYLSHRVLPRLDEILGAGSRVRITFGLSDPLLAELSAGGTDLVVSAIRPRLAGISATPLVDEEFALVGAPRWRPAGPGDPADPRRWQGVPVIAYAEQLPIIRRFWRTVFGRRPAEIVPWAIVPDLRTIAAMVVAGLGVSVLPTYLVADDLTAGRLVRLADPELPPLNTLHLAVRTGALDRDPALRAVHAGLLRIGRDPAAVSP
ncbi:LysR family transcriptional regulator [Nakamurella sp.]|uniref:LysR family transcriptional regulator n=1 Tax=Nakamurella sp. TaxID=1869182 RepID=UPI003B3AA1BF